MRKNNGKNQWQGSAKNLAAGLMCLASFVAPLAADALAADNLTISGAYGGSSVGWATFTFGSTTKNTTNNKRLEETWNGWALSLAPGGVDPNSTVSNAGVVTADTVSLEKKPGGALNVNIGTLDVTGASSTLALNRTMADEVTFGTVALGGGNTFTVKSTDSGGATLNNLTVSGTGNTLLLDGTTANLAVNGLSLAGNAGLTVTSQNSGTASLNNLNVSGTGNTLTAPTTQRFTNVNLFAGSALTSINTLNFSTLNVYGKTQYNGALFAAGKNLYFYLPATVAAGDTLLKVTGSALDIRGSTIGVGVIGKNFPLSIGEKVTLIDATANGLTADASYTNTVTGMQGISKAYVFGLTVDMNTLLATVSDIRPTDPAVRKSPAEGVAATVALVGQGGELAAGAGMGNAQAASRGGSGGNLGVAGFGAVSGGASRYNSGSHVDVNSLSFMTGLAKTWQIPAMDILGGVFFEAGYGSYETYNGLEDGGSIRGKGDSRYFGGGFLARLDMTESLLRGLYAEASLRAGGMDVDYKSDPLAYSGHRASYETNAAYYGIHTGLGYLWLFDDKASLDLYAKYFWNHTTGDNVTILGDPVRFKAVNSHRTRLGTRFGYALTESVTPYVGAAWEYEFDGKARSVVAGEGAPAPSLRGNTGVGELGLTWKPVAVDALSFDFGIQGYTGVREGVSGNVQLKFEF